MSKAAAALFQQRRELAPCAPTEVAPLVEHVDLGQRAVGIAFAHRDSPGERPGREPQPPAHRPGAACAARSTPVPHTRRGRPLRLRRAVLAPIQSSRIRQSCPARAHRAARQRVAAVAKHAIVRFAAAAVFVRRSTSSTLPPGSSAATMPPTPCAAGYTPAPDRAAARSPQCAPAPAVSVHSSEAVCSASLWSRSRSPSVAKCAIRRVRRFRLCRHTAACRPLRRTRTPRAYPADPRSARDPGRAAATGSA